MATESAGLLAFRRSASGWQVLLAHPGGPFFSRKDDGAWTIPKGAPNPGEALIDAARREFQEELGIDPGSGPLLALGSVRQRAGKIVHGWAVQVELAEFTLHSNDFELEWPPGTGRRQRFPEVDRAEFFSFETASRKILAAQQPFLERLAPLLPG